MKIGIYNEPSEGGIGGCEYSVAVLAEGLGHSLDVEIVHHRPGLTPEALAEFAGVDLGPVGMRYVAYEPFAQGVSHNPLKRHREARSWQASLSAPYDIFINFTHHYPPYCQARKGILHILFPLHERPLAEFQAEALQRGERFQWARLKRLYYDWDWARRMESYQIKYSISEFTRHWTKRRWGIDSEVVYPPVEIDCRSVEKSNLILSSGRFAISGHSKNQLEMVRAFARMHRSGLQDWEYVCVGGLGNLPAEQAYFESVRQAGAQCPARVLANVERAGLVEFRERAKIFWHAAGLAVAEEEPQLMEHFGIATVEAMAAGCVPVVANRGGQAEIVEHGVSGFLCNSADEFISYSQLMMRDENQREKMAEAARNRARAFGKHAFVESFRKQIDLSAPSATLSASCDAGRRSRARR